jgi:hypothetical protein
LIAVDFWIYTISAQNPLPIAENLVGWGAPTLDKNHLILYGYQPIHRPMRSSVVTSSDRRSMAGIPHHAKTSYNYVKIDEHN